MSTNKQALRTAAEKAISEEGETWWNEEQLASDYGLALHRADAKFIAAANPAIVLALLDELEAAEKRIAGLEAREVKLPQRQEPTSSGHYGEGYLVPSNAGSALDYEETVDALAAAGITVKGVDGGGS